MQILEIRVLKGPNYWSIRRPKLIQMKLDLEHLEYRPSNMIDGFRERIEQLLPSMIEHQCSEGHRGGFFKRVEDGTWMGHIIEHIALEIQSLAGMDLGFGRTRSTGERDGIYNVVFEYEQEEAGIYTAKAAVRIAQALVDGEKYNLEADIKTLRNFKEESKLLPVVTKSKNRQIPIIAIAGSRGKTTTAHIITHIAQSSGKRAVCSTSEDVLNRNQLIIHNDYTWQESAHFILKDPTVEMAIFKCDHRNILDSGLAFQQCNMAIVTSITSDYVGSNGIQSIEQLAKIEQVVPETVSEEGYAILNADEDLVYKMQESCHCNIALFSISENNPRIKAHCEKGHKAAILENGYISIITAGGKVRVIPVKDIPLASDGQNISSILAAVLSTFLFQEITLENIRKSLQTLTPLSTQKLEGTKLSI